MPSPSFFQEGHEARRTDTLWKATEKILGALNDGAGGSGVYVGRDPLPPDDPTKGAISYPAGGGTLTQWDVASQTWV